MISRLAPGVCLGFACVLLAGCGGFPTGPEADAIAVPSPNHNARRPNFVIIHDTSNDSVAPALRTLTDPAREVSSHYLIGRDGTLYQLVDESRRAWHAGASNWQGRENCNNFSIGIELEGCDTMPFEPAQYERLAVLIVELERRYPIEAVVGHSDIAPGRKTDPGPFFDWKRLDVMCKQRRASC